MPTPLGEADKFVKDDAINVSAFWELTGRPVVRSEAADVWLLGSPDIHGAIRPFQTFG